ncbi:MAG: hypothetical protein MI739_02950 [Bacteroidales bacterium]|nr:hypothetical protein [Bacteroidales bacterium]
MKNNIKNSILLVLTLFVVVSCVNYKILEKSKSQKPDWVHGIETNYLIGQGIGKNYDEAKLNALHMIKEKIVSSVAQNISFEQNIKVNEIRYKKAIEFLEEYTSETKSKAGGGIYLKGISLSRVTDYYWERFREEKKEQVVYFIKYPFSPKDIQQLVDKWNEREVALSNRLDTLKFIKNNYYTIDEIVTDIEELQYLSDIFVDERKAWADIAIKKLQNKLQAIKIVSNTDSLGYFSYSLMLENHLIKTSRVPVVESNCAEIIKIDKQGKYNDIEYNYNNCEPDEKNYLDINYPINEIRLSKRVCFDVCLKKILIQNIDDVSFSSQHKNFFNKWHTIKCHFTIESKSPLPFIIDKIELFPKLCKRKCKNNDNYKNYPAIIIENIDKEFKGKGTHPFTQVIKLQKSKTKSWVSRNGVSTKISGKIYYHSEQTGEHKICKFDDFKYYTNW